MNTRYQDVRACVPVFVSFVCMYACISVSVLCLCVRSISISNLPKEISAAQKSTNSEQRQHNRKTPPTRHDKHKNKQNLNNARRRKNSGSLERQIFLKFLSWLSWELVCETMSYNIVCLYVNNILDMFECVSYRSSFYFASSVSVSVCSNTA